ncbi:MAG: S24/S26 family peptidase [Bacillales bacterium]|nr:S24/S26 family peptidase [Bacillales bacterium]
MSNELVNFEELLKRDGSFLYTFKGVSMKPLLNQGKDVVIISSIDRPIKKLDIVLYKVNERYVLHRVLKIKKDQYVIRGDNTYSEEFIPKDKVFGILTSYYKNDKLKKVNTKGAILLYYLWLTTYPLRWLLVKTKRLLRRIIKGK